MSAVGKKDLEFSIANLTAGYFFAFIARLINGLTCKTILRQKFKIVSFVIQFSLIKFIMSFMKL